MIRNIIFDWSGTLVDDLPVLLEATNSVLRSAGRWEHQVRNCTTKLLDRLSEEKRRRSKVVSRSAHEFYRETWTKPLADDEWRMT